LRIEAHAPAKLVLIGEYAVLEGAPAIVAAVDRLVRVSLTPGATDAPRPWSIRSDLGGGQAGTLAFDEAGALTPGEPWLRPLEVVLERAARSLGMRPDALPGGDVVIESASLFVDAGRTKLGLGSSAAVVTALSAALQDALAHWNLSDGNPASLGEDLATHRLVQQGPGSGVDIAASVVGGVLRYQLVEGRPEVRGLQLPPGVEFRAVWTGASASTRHFVDGVRAWKTKAPEAFATAITEMSALAAQAVDACDAGSASAFLAAVRGYHEAMDSLGVQAGLPIVSDPHRTIAGLAASEGVAYKPSGAGGGDVGLLFAASEPALVEAGRLAERAGYRLLDLGVHPAGVTVERHERTAS
jgi:phosphomevalonate kinase